MIGGAVSTGHKRSLVSCSVRKPKQKASAPGLRMKLIQDFQSLARQGNDVRLFHFHAFGGNAPFGIFKIDLFPFGLAEFVGAHEN